RQSYSKTVAPLRDLDLHDRPLRIYNVYPLSFTVQPHIPSGPRPMAATPVRDTSTRPSGRIRSTNWLILAELPVISNTRLSVEASITRARNASASRSASTR